MATLDLSRSALRLDVAELKLALDLARGEPPPASELTALEAAGIVHAGTLTRLPSRILEVVSEPKLRLVVERFVADAPVVEEAWAVEDRAVWGSVEDGVLVLTPLEPRLLPWQVMRVVGLGPRSPVAPPLRLSLAAATLDNTWRALAEEGRYAAEQLLEADLALDAEARSRFIERRSSWRASSVWTAPDGEVQEVSVAIVDGGRMGLWESRPDDDDDALLHLHAVTPGAVWKTLVRLVPPTDPLSSVSVPPGSP